VTLSTEKASAGTASRRLRLVFILMVALGFGATYLSYRAPEVAQKPAPLPTAQAGTPAAQAPAPAFMPPTFDAVSADASGMLVAAGRGQPGSSILLQNGPQTLGQTKADGNGEWVLILEQPLPPGDYTLSLSALNTDTQASVPGPHVFALTIAPRSKPAPPAQTAAAIPSLNLSAPAVPDGPAAKPQAPARVAPVRRGDTLWRLARRYYGRGMRYNEIVEANKPQIKNPDLIYPRQQLAIPR